jgi:hypothetical protein
MLWSKFLRALVAVQAMMAPMTAAHAGRRSPWLLTLLCTSELLLGGPVSYAQMKVGVNISATGPAHVEHGLVPVLAVLQVTLLAHRRRQLRRVSEIIGVIAVTGHREKLKVISPTLARPGD